MPLASFNFSLQKLDEIEVIPELPMSNFFFWGVVAKQICCIGWILMKPIHWKRWETPCQPKECRGMDLKDLVKFSEAMLVKQV